MSRNFLPYIIGLLFCSISIVSLAQKKNNKIVLNFNELQAPVEMQSNNIKVQKLGEALKVNAFGRVDRNGTIVPIDLILTLPKYDYTSTEKRIYKNPENHAVTSNEATSLVIKLGDDSYSSFYREKTGDDHNTKSITTDYTITVQNLVGETSTISISFAPGTFLSTSVKDNENLKRITFSVSEQVFLISNPYPEGLKAITK